MTERPPLIGRLTEFSKQIILFCKNVPQDTISRPLISQLVRSATSIGANYTESQNGISRADFRAKVYICKKEAQESSYWLELLETCTAAPNQAERTRLKDEALQIVKILQTITNKLD